MAAPSDEELSAALREAGVAPSPRAALPAAMHAGAPHAGASDEELRAALSGVGLGEHQMGVGEGMLQSALHGLTFGATDNLLSNETIAARKKFGEQHPILSTIGEGAGVALPMFTPAGVTARVASAAPRLAGAAARMLPYANWSRTVGAGVPLRTLFHQGGLGAAKYGMWERLLSPPSEQDKAQMQERFPDASPGMTNFAARAYNMQPFSRQGLQDYALGGAGAYLGNRAGTAIGRAAESIASGHALGANPAIGARLDIARGLREDAPGQSVQDLLDRVRASVYGDTAWTNHYAAFRDNPNLQRTIVQAHQEALQNLPAGAPPRAAEDQIFDRLTNPNHPQALVDPQSGRPFNLVSTSHLAQPGARYSDATIRDWIRTSAQQYEQANPVPAYLHELVAAQTGGEAPTLQDLARRNINLGENPTRSAWLQGIRGRQQQINPQVQRLTERLMNASGDVGEAIEAHTRNARLANAQYPQVMADFQALGQDARDRVSAGLWPTIQRVLDENAHTDPVSSLVRRHAEMFLEPQEQQLAPAGMRPIYAQTRQAMRDSTGRLTGYEVGQVPLYDQQGQPLQRFDLGSRAVSWQPSGDLEQVLRVRGVLSDAIRKAETAAGNRAPIRGSPQDRIISTEGRELAGLKRGIDQALEGMGDTANAQAYSQAQLPPFQRLQGAMTGQGPSAADTAFADVMGRWHTANDSRALAGSLERTYNRFLGLPLAPTRGQGLLQNAHAWRAFNGMDDMHQDMARRGLMAQLAGKMNNQGEMHDVAKIFTNGAMRQQMGRVLGPELADELYRTVTRAGLATNTFNMNRGSQTGKLAEKKGELSLHNLTAAVMHFDPLHAIRMAGQVMGGQLHKARNDEVSRLLSTGTHNPAELERVLNQVLRTTRPANAINGFERNLRRSVAPALSQAFRAPTGY